MDDEGLRPGAVERAAAWLHAHQRDYTREALVESLRAQGFTAGEITAAEARAAEMTAPESPATGMEDLRGRAAMVLLIAFVGTWLAIGILAGLRWGSSSATVIAVILGIALGIVAFPSLAVIRGSDRLRRGTAGTLVAILAIPFLLLFVIAGMCVSSTNMLGP